MIRYIGGLCDVKISCLRRSPEGNGIAAALCGNVTSVYDVQYESIQSLQRTVKADAGKSPCVQKQHYDVVNL